MLIGVMNTMVVLVMRYLYFVKVIGQKLLHGSIPARRIFGLLTPLPPKYKPRGTKFAQNREL